MKRRGLLSSLAAVILAACTATPGMTPASETPTATQAASDAATSTAEAQASRPPVVDETPAAAPTATPPPSELAAGPATVAVDQLRVRVHPALDAPQVTYVYGDNNVVSEVRLELYEGMPVWILDDDPVVRDGFGWRKIAVSNVLYNDGSILVGWVAHRAADGSAWLVPFLHDCPAIVDATIDQPDLDSLRWMSLLGLACFGERSVAFAAYWPELPPDAGLGGVCGAPEPRWLLCTNVHYAHVNVSGDTSWAFPVYAAEGPETVLGPRGRWLLLSGHFDDPAAQHCAAAAGPDQSPDALEMFCRTRFVLESADPISRP